MKILLLASLLVHNLSHLNAQVANTHDFSSVSTSQNATPYLFPDFVKGMVYFRNGTKREARLNYHFADGQVRFLSSRADTLVFTGKYLVDHIVMGGRTFLLTDTHSDMEAIETAGNTVLAVRRQPGLVGDHLSHSAQQFSASAASTPSGLMVSNNGGHFQWENNSSGQLWRLKSTYFLVDQNKIVHPASRRAFIKVYARYRRQVTRYLRENRVDFANGNDLRKLLTFCGGLAGL
jgi:hypothetical protein